MRYSHFEALAPICPRCCHMMARETPLRLAPGAQEVDGAVIQGRLLCSADDCGQEYPIIDGAPVLVPDVRTWVSSNLLHITVRDDLCADVETLLGDAAGPGSLIDSYRQLVSSYAWDHYAANDPLEPAPSAPHRAPGRAMAAARHGLDLLDGLPDGPLIDMGCATGGVSLGLAATTGRMVLGVDSGIALLRFAQRVLRHGQVSYDRRRVGMVYDRRTFPLNAKGSENVDFWIADGAALPFRDGVFAGAVALNVLDCVPDPPGLLADIARVLAPGGGGVLSCPYDWSSQATMADRWLGGHSQRGPQGGAAEPVLRALLSGDASAMPRAVSGLSVEAEESAYPWRVRLHDRSAMDYDVHLLALRRESDGRRATVTGTPAVAGGCGCEGGHR